MENIQAFSTALIGVALVSAALQGYLIGLGDLGQGSRGMFVRIFIGISGLVLALPAGGLFGLSQLFLIGLTLTFFLTAIGFRHLFVAEKTGHSSLN